MDTDFSTIMNSLEETIEFGRRLGLQLRGGEVIALCGPLGSGKTHLIKGIAAGAGGGKPHSGYRSVSTKGRSAVFLHDSKIPRLE